MPKKLTIISSLIGISISTLGAVVPTFADATTIYTVADVAAHHAAFVAEVEETCGEYSTDPSYSGCLNAIIAKDKNENPGEYTTMYSVDRTAKGAIVSAYNPYAGTMRFYINTDQMLSNSTTNFQNLVIFWADQSYSNSYQLGGSAGIQGVYAWRIADAILEGRETPEGVHVMYASEQGKENWFISGTEHRVVVDDESNFLTESYPRAFFILGYDTNGNRILNTTNYGGACGDLPTDSECQIQLKYTAGDTFAPIGFEVGKATAEDLALIERKEIINAAKAMVREAEARAEAAAATAREAEARAEAAEAAAREAGTIADEAKDAAREANEAAREAEAIAREAEATAREMEAIANEATVAAGEAEARAEAAEAAAREAEATVREVQARAEAAEATAREAEAAAREAEAAAREAVSRASQMAEEARIAIEETNRTAEEASRTAKEANRVAEEISQTAKEASLLASEATKKIAGLSETSTIKIDELKEKIAKINSWIDDNKTKTGIIEKTIEKPVFVATPSNPVSNPAPIAATDVTKPITAVEETIAKKEDHIDVPLAAEEEKVEFPWWIVVFIFSGIALILWWFVPSQKKSQTGQKSQKKS
ncbi:hypothetical protein IKG24_00900 [Candidatus Saccharibacteria bacterium]|nr:hypothetical protein [Candidatus Saccharibacteria bacterium]